MLDKNNHYSPLPQALSDDEDEYKHGGGSNGIEMDRVYNMNHRDENLTPLISVQVGDGNRKAVMSCLRRFCFLLSVSVACVVVLSFLWLLPCDVGYAPCRSAGKVASKSTGNWNAVFTSKAFRAGILEIVDADKDGRMDVVLGYRRMNGKINFAESLENFSYSAGVIALRGYNGEKIWEHQYHGAPTDVLCNEIDVNQDGVDDCILVGELGLFSAVDVSNGCSFWYLHDHDKKQRRPTDVSIPAIVPDLNEDETDDLVVTCHLNDNATCQGCNNSYLLIVSGETGEIIGGHLPLSDCAAASKPLSVNVNGSIYLIFHCKSSDESGSVFIISLEDLKDYILANITDIDTSVSSGLMLLHRFNGQGSHVHLVYDDLDLDERTDILLIGGDGEVAAYQSSTLSLSWLYQKKGFDVVSCTLGPTIEDKFKVVLLTFIPQNCSDDCFTTIVGLAGTNGSEIWFCPLKSITSPVVLPKSNIWQNLVAFKAFERTVENKTENKSFSDEDISELGENTSEDGDNQAVAFDEKLLVLNSELELQHETIQENTKMCYGSAKFLTDCLPVFGFRASSAVGDFDGDQRADLISITTYLDLSVNGSWNLRATKTNLATNQEETNDFRHVHSFHTFE